MAGLSQRELEKLVNEIACELDEVTDEQAENSDIGGDSDAEDGLLSPCVSSSCTSRMSKTSTPIILTERDTPSTSRDSNTQKASRTRNIFPVLETAPDSAPEDDSFDDSNDDENWEPEVENVIRTSHITVEDLLLHEDDNENLKENVDPNANAEIYTWKREAKDPKAYSSATFQENFGPKCSQALRTPISFFSLFFTDFLVCDIISQSKIYAEQQGQVLDLQPEEFKAFLGIIIFMGFHYLPGIRMYWSNDENLHCERIARVMPVKRFLKILRFLHLANNEEMPRRGSPDFDRLYKVRPLLDYFGEVFKDNFSPSRFLSIDESMVAFKGRCSMKQYMPMKPIKRGLKVWVMCCAVTGYMLAFDVYTGKSPDGTTTGSLGEQVVLKLSAALDNVLYCIFFDNFFTSVNLVAQLLKKGFFACGTVRTNRKNLPQNNMKSDKELKQHQMDYSMAGDISFVRWSDRGKKPVSILSSFHNPSKTTKVSRKNQKGEIQEVSCPEAISSYNKYMGGVDRMDQMIAAYSVARKSRHWWMKLFYYFLDCAIVNSYILYKENMKKHNQKGLSHLNFRSTLVNELIGSFTSKRKRGYQPMKGHAKKRKSGASTVSNTIRHSGVGTHLPEMISTYRRCAHCSTRAKEKRSNMICRTCNVALCKKCFSAFHVST